MIVIEEKIYKNKLTSHEFSQKSTILVFDLKLFKD